MPGLAPPFDDEREQLLAFLAQQRHVLRVAAHGLTDEQARATPTVSPLSVGGLVKHVAFTERTWMRDVLQEPQPDQAVTQYARGFELADRERLADVLALADAVAARTEEIVRSLPLDHPVPVPQDAPWFPKDIEAWTLRWVLLHLITETARHAGHADFVRESIDGATAFPLLAAAEAWEPTPWLQPWTPSPSF